MVVAEPESRVFARLAEGGLRNTIQVAIGGRRRPSSTTPGCAVGIREVARQGAEPPAPASPERVRTSTLNT
jgi:hypothetical protein